MPNTKFQQHRVFVRNDLIEKIIRSCKKTPKDFLEFKIKLGLDPNLVTCDEQDIISALPVSFEGEIILTQYCIENKKIDAYFSEYKLGIEIDEYNHESRNFNYEKSRQLMIESHGITIIRTNPDAADFDINKLINQIYEHISQPNKKLEKEKEVETKKLKNKIKEQENKIEEQKSKFAKELLSCVSSISMSAKHIQYFVKKILPTLQNMKNTQSKIKPIKIGKEPRTTYYMQNCRPQEAKMTNKVLTEKSYCLVCRSNKSRFLKQKINQQLVL